jgi:hypothetical protein
MATIPGTGVCVATSKGITLWDGTKLGSAGLDGAFGDAEVTALAARGTQLWIGTTKDLYIFASNKLQSLPDVANVTKLWAATGANEVIASTGAGLAIGIRDDMNGIATRTLSTELSGASAIVPGAQDRMFAIVGGRLEERVTVASNEIEWLPVAFTMDPKDSGATGVSALAVDPGSGNAWIIDGGSIVQIQGDAVSTMAAPASMGTVVAIAATVDGALYVSNGATIFAFTASTSPSPSPNPNPDPNPNPNPNPSVTYMGNIAAFSNGNCNRCHSESAGVAFPLTSYDAWTQNIDLIITAVQTKVMPKDGAALVGGDVNLLIQWKDQGLKK